jgi:glucose-1-phosphate cytidylyltransferase
MKAIILAGGLGTRISEESHRKPKPMIEIGGKPILWHIMKQYSAHGIQDFIICLGYKGYAIKDFFANYFLHTSDVTFDMRNNKMEVHQNYSEPWRVTLVDTGEETMTGGRLKRAGHYLENDETFCFTYGDAVLGFTEKPRGDGGWINGGFFVLSSKVLPYIRDDATSWEAEPLAQLAAEGQLHAFQHEGFWHPMDTLRDMNYLEQLWQSGEAPWKTWS